MSDAETIQKEINRLGGIQPLEGKYYPLNEAEIAEVEQEVRNDFPKEYSLLLNRYGSFLFANSVAFVPIKSAPEYSHEERLGIPNGSVFSGSEVSVVYGKRHNNQKFELLQNLRVFRDRMPEGFLPFADDGLGNQLCLGLNTEHVPKVYWWDHELEWDAEDYEAETGTPMPVEAKYQNVYLVANSLTEFFERLTISFLAI